MLGSNELAVSSADDFERSNEAHRIFMDVFYGRNVAEFRENGDFVTRNIVGFGLGPQNYSVCISRYYLDTSTKRMKRSDGGVLSAPRNESSNGDLPITVQGRDRDGNASQSKCHNRVTRSNTITYPVHEKSHESTPFTSNVISPTVSNNSLTDLYSRLRDHVNYLLKAAGWVIEKKKVGKKSFVHTTYKSPTGEIFTAFYKIWDLFGKSLLMFAGSSYKMVQQEDGKQWINIKEFGSDLSQALIDFETEDCSQMEPTYALVRKWSLLDPFVTVVMIKKQILTLRKGMPVKVATTVVSDLRDADSVAEGIEAVPTQQDNWLNLALELRPPNLKNLKKTQGDDKALEFFTPADAVPEFENARKKLAQSGCSGTAASNLKMGLLTSGTTVTCLTKKRRRRNF
ncbi:uncharacterized protein LOC113361096 [Papaver somniferum]|uniref:uncharacterized protein LOC113361096 n=1 Tax=Papaver somniferum TaxID=3469 RepID=UPI000E6FBDCF|nr:uncharacterized protein LOC113361096 [Papaver somniferum]